MQKLYFILLFISLLVGSHASAQSNSDEIRWMTWEEVENASKVEKRKIFVDLYTDWCTWCKKMDAKTLSKPHIAEYLNKNFYAVKFDAQHREDIILNGRTYTYVKNGKHGFNELAIEITQGKMSFPTVVFMEEDLSVIQPIPGFQDCKRFEKLMTYYAENYYRTTPWRQFSRNFNSQYLVPTGGR